MLRPFELPERPGVLKPLKRHGHLTAVVPHFGYIIRVHTSAKIISGKEFDQIRQGNNPASLVRFKLGPITKMFFRPEESHGASGVWNVLEPIHKWNGHIPYNSLRRVLFKDDPVLHLQMDRFSAIQAGSIDMDCFSGEKPADRQRFKSSLCKPFLLAVNGDFKLCRQVIKRSKRRDKIGIRVQPAWYAGFE